MALTITIEGKGVIANADSLTDDTGGTGTGDWDEDGGGSISLTTDTFLYGSSCVAGAYSNKSGYQYFDIGDGNQLDFDVAGAEEGQHIFIWIHCPTIGLLETKANKGLAIRLGTSLSDYREYLIAGSDDANGWNGGWKCFVVDPTKTGSVSDTGSYDYGSIRYIGVWIDAAALAKGDNIFIDQIAVGFGLRITGTSTTAWKDAVDYCTDYPNRAWGMLQEREGIYYAYGKIYIGDAADQSAAVSFSDSGRIIQFGESEYWNGSAWVTLADIDYSGIIVEDHTSYSTTFVDGIIVGTDKGRSGSVIIGHENHDVSIDLYGGNNAGSVTTLFGTTIKNITGPINSGNDVDHKFLSCSFIGCSQFDPVGAALIRNCIFAETADVDSALLWNVNIDIQDCSFIANTTGAAIEHTEPLSAAYEYDGLIFSGNTYDVLNSSGTAITVENINLSNAGTYEGSLVTFESAVYITVYVKDTENADIVGASVAVYKDSDDSELMNEYTDSNGVAQASFNYPGSDVDIYVRVRKSSEGDLKYVPAETTGTILTSGFTLTVVLTEDIVAE